MGWHADEYQIEEVDLFGVIDWINQRVPTPQRYTLYACIAMGQQLGLVHLYGDDPSSSRVSPAF